MAKLPTVKPVPIYQSTGLLSSGSGIFPVVAPLTKLATDVSPTVDTTYGTAYTVTLHGTPTRVASTYGATTAIQLAKASSQYIDFGHCLSPAAFPYTVAMRVRLDGAGDWRRLFSSADVAGEGGDEPICGVNIGATDAFKLTLTIGNNTSAYSDGATSWTDSVNALVQDTWYNIVIVIHDKDLRVEFWVNGELWQARKTADAVGYAPGSRNAVAGRYPYGSGAAYSTHTLDCLMVTNTAWTPIQCAAFNNDPFLAVRNANAANLTNMGLGYDGAIADNIVLPLGVNIVNHPAAIYSPAAKKTYYAVNIKKQHPAVGYYDHALGVLVPPLDLHGSGITDDSHGAPAICLDNTGRICVFYGSHNSPQFYTRSTNPYDLSAWDKFDYVFWIGNGGTKSAVAGDVYKSPNGSAFTVLDTIYADANDIVLRCSGIADPDIVGNVAGAVNLTKQAGSNAGSSATIAYTLVSHEGMVPKTAHNPAYIGHTYPQPYLLNNGTIGISLRSELTTGVVTCYQIFKTWDGTTWSADKNLLADQYPYAQSYYDPIRNVWHLFWSSTDRANGGAAGRNDLYYMRSADYGATWTKADGTAYTLPVTYATCEKVYDSGTTSATADSNPVVGSISVDSNGYPMIVWNASQKIKFVKWTGSAWSTPVDICTIDNVFDAACLLVDSSTQYRIYATYATPSGYHVDTTGRGGELLEYTSTDSGATWTNTKTIMRGTVGGVMPVERNCSDGQCDIILVGGDDGASSVYLYGANYGTPPASSDGSSFGSLAIG